MRCFDVMEGLWEGLLEVEGKRMIYLIGINNDWSYSCIPIATLELMTNQSLNKKSSGNGTDIKELYKQRLQRPLSERLSGLTPKDFEETNTERLQRETETLNRTASKIAGTLSEDNFKPFQALDKSYIEAGAVNSPLNTQEDLDRLLTENQLVGEETILLLVFVVLFFFFSFAFL